MANGMSEMVGGLSNPVCDGVRRSWVEEISDGTTTCPVKVDRCGDTAVFKLEESGCDFRLSAKTGSGLMVDLPVTNIVLLWKSQVIFALKNPNAQSGVDAALLTTELKDGKRTLIEDSVRFYTGNDTEPVSELLTPWVVKFAESR